jgi:hypothetical protein
MLASEFVAIVEKHGGFTWKKVNIGEMADRGIRLYWEDQTVTYSLVAIARLTGEQLESSLIFFKTSEQFMSDWEALPDCSEVSA